MAHSFVRTIQFNASTVALATALTVSAPALASEEETPSDGVTETEVSAAETIVTSTTTSTAIAAQPQPVIEEENRYHMQLIAQIFDGSDDFSHSQTAGFARMREGDESWSMLDFGDEAVVIEKQDGSRELGRFESTSAVEQAFHYNYSTKMLAGDGAAAKYHNQFVRPQLDRGPELGSDAKWSATMSLEELGFSETSGDRLKVNLSRDYFTHEGKDFVLVEYEVPAFGYKNSSGKDVVHWASGLSLMDPGFGQIYWNTALHRAISQEADGVERPYRFVRSVTAIGEGKKALVDPRKMPEIASKMAKYSGEAATGLIPFVGGGQKADQLPIEIAAKLDVMALALGENSANQAPETSFAQLFGENGSKVTPPGGNGIEQVDPVVAPIDQTGSLGQAAAAFFKQAAAFDTQRKNLVRSVNYQAGRYNAAKKTIEALYENAIKTGQTVGDVQSSPAYIRNLKAMNSATSDLNNSRATIRRMAATQGKLVKYANDIGATKLAGYASDFADTKAGKALGGAAKFVSVLDHLSNVNTVERAAQNLEQDTSSGEIVLTRDYDSNLSLGLELAALAGDAYSGNIVGFTSDAVAITAGSATDIFVSYKGYIQSLQQQIKASEESVDVNTRRAEQLRARYEEDKQNVLDTIARERAEREAKTQADWDKYYKEKYTGYHPNWDPKTKSWKPGTRQWREQQELAREQQIAESDVENGRPTPKEKKIVVVTLDWGERGYPVYDPSRHKKNPDPKRLGQQFSDIPDWLLTQWEKDAEQAKRQEELNELQSEILRRRRLSEAEKDKERSERIANSSFSDIKPVNFDPPKWRPVTWTPPAWTPPEWKPPEWVPPEFDAPEPSEIEWTNFDDKDWDLGGKVPSWTYGNLVGTVETDLSKWADWLATQDVRDLERLARNAGYPNLASALNDWKNLTRQANDAGFRRWAGQQPPCYMVCVNTLGRWQLKASQLALGDILNDSREIFSTAGLSDISISGFVLRYILRDFGAEDGDIINVVISQFGRSIFETELSLLNAGTDFEINLRPGVASVVITAINEGAFSPNTAEINLQNVVEGESVQTYSLLTGETATLRVNPGRVGGGISGLSTSTERVLLPTGSSTSMTNRSQQLLNGRFQTGQDPAPLDGQGMTDLLTLLSTVPADGSGDTYARRQAVQKRNPRRVKDNSAPMEESK